MAEGQGSGCWKFAAIGCAVLILLAAAVGAGVYFMVRKAMDEGQIAIQRETARQVEVATADAEFTEEQRALVDTLLEHSQRSDIGFAATLVSSGTLMMVLEDKAIDEEELGLLKEVTDLLGQNPDPSWVEMGTWMNAHPELKTRFEQLQQTQGHGGVVHFEPRGGVVHFEPTEPAETTEPAPEEDASAPEEAGVPPEVQQ